MPELINLKGLRKDKVKVRISRAEGWTYVFGLQKLRAEIWWNLFSFCALGSDEDELGRSELMVEEEEIFIEPCALLTLQAPSEKAEPTPLYIQRNWTRH